MNTDQVARTYAQALLDAADGKGLLDEVRDEAEFLRSLVADDAQFRLFIENPRNEQGVIRSVLETAFRGKVSDLLLNFLLLVIDKGRAFSLGAILEEFRTLYDKKVGLVRAEATAAVPLSEESLGNIRSALESRLNQKVEITGKVDPSVLGGVVVRYDGMVVDASLATSLNQVRSRLSTLRFGSEYIHED
ncbi:MAG: ATP synthase F1 subunit delta [Planctomycetota bacterium]